MVSQSDGASLQTNHPSELSITVFYPRPFFHAAVGVALLILAVLPAQASCFGLNPFVSVEPWTGVAIEGFDPVSYFTDKTPRPGRATHEILWSDAAWRFANPGNRAAFEAHPDVYAPRFGGLDPMGVLRGVLVQSRADLFAFGSDGHLYLFSDEASRDAFLADPSVPERAQEAWQRLTAQSVL